MTSAGAGKPATAADPSVKPDASRRPTDAPGPGGDGRVVLWPALVAAGVGLVIRLLFLITGAGDPFRTHLGLDMAGYDSWARAILHGQGPAPFTQAPLFPLLLAGVYAILGPDPVRALWAQLVPGVLAVFLVALAAGRWKGPIAGWAAGLLLALYKPAIFYTGVLLPPAWVLAAAALCLWLTLRIAQPRDRSNRASGAAGSGQAPASREARAAVALLLAGLSFGVLALGQPAAFLAVVPAAWFLIRPAGGGGNSGTAGRPDVAGRTKRLGVAGGAGPAGTAVRAGHAGVAGRARPVAFFAAGCLLPLILTLLHNGISGGVWSPVAVNGGINLYIGNGPEANGAYVRPAGMREDMDLLGLNAARRGLGSTSGTEGGAVVGGDISPGQADRYWTSRALAFAASHPIRSLGLGLRKVFFFFGGYEIPEMESLSFESRYAGLLRWPLPGMALLSALAVVGAWLLFRRDSVARWLTASAAVVAIGVCVFFVAGRFRIPVAPFLAVLAGGGLAEAARIARGAPADRHPQGIDPAGPARKLAVPVAVAIVTGIFLSLNLAGIDAKASDGQYYFRLGAILEQENNLSGAMDDYRSALSLDPSLGKAEVNLGGLLARQGKFDEARRHLERGVELDPLSAPGLVNLGQLYVLEGRAGDALDCFQRAMAADPASISARENTWMTLYEMGRIDEACGGCNGILGLVPNGSGQPAGVRARQLLQIVGSRTGLDPIWRKALNLRRADLRLVQGDKDGSMRLYKLAFADADSKEAARRMLTAMGVAGGP